MDINEFAQRVPPNLTYVWNSKAHIKERLYEKGFRGGTLPALRREAKEPSLQAILPRSRDGRELLARVISPERQVRRVSSQQRLQVQSREKTFRSGCRLAGTEEGRKRYLLERMAGKHEGARRVQNIDEEDEDLLAFFEEEREESSHKIDKFIKAVTAGRAGGRFLYVVKDRQRDSPYDLHVVRKEMRPELLHRGEYFTISSQGVCHYIECKPYQFVPLQQWLQQREIFFRIKRLRFFTKFRQWKTLKHWRGSILRHSKRQAEESLQAKFFLLNPELRSVLLQVRKHAFSMETLRLLSFQRSRAHSQGSFSLELFRKVQQENQTYIKKFISRKSDACREVVSLGFRRLSRQLRNSTMQPGPREEGPESKTINSLKEAAYEDLGFDPGIDFKNRSLLRKQCSKFLRFSFLVDFVVMNSLKNIFIDSVTEAEARLQSSTGLFSAVLTPDFRPVPEQELQTQMLPDFDPDTCPPEFFNLQAHVRMKDEDSAPHPTLFPRRVVPSLHKHWLSLLPEADDFYQATVQSMRKGIESLHVFQRWSKHREMLPYVKVLEEWDNKVGDNWGVARDGQFLRPSEWIEGAQLELFSSRLKLFFQNAFLQMREAVKKKFSPFLMAFWENSMVQVEVFTRQNLHSPGLTIQYALRLFKAQKFNFARELPETFDVKQFRLDSSLLRKILINSPETKFEEMQRVLPPWLDDVSLSLKAYLAKIKVSFSSLASSIADYVRQINELKEVRKRLPRVKETVALVGQVFSILEQGRQGILKDWKGQHFELTQALIGVQAITNSAEEALQRNQESFAKDLTSVLLPGLEREVGKISACLGEKRYLNNELTPQQILSQLAEIETQIKKCEEDSNRYNLYEQTLGLALSRFESIELLRQNFSSRHTLWSSLKEWKDLTSNWSNRIFNDIDTDEIKAASEKYSRIVARCVKALPPNPVLEELKRLLNTFKNTLPIVLALRNPFLQKQYHWNKIRQRVGRDFSLEDQSFTLQSLIALDLQPFREELIEISSQAKQEKLLRQLLEENKVKWDKLCLDLVPHRSDSLKAKDFYILTRIDELYLSLDELLANLTNVLGNRHLVRFRKQAEDLRRQIASAQEVLDDWTVVQKIWIYLQSIFSTSDIKLKLKEESAAFEAVSKSLSNHMKKAHSSRSLAKNISSPEYWRKHRQTLAKIEKSLENYLEEKRNAFPRFCFLSNEQLIELLAKAAEMVQIQQCVQKCFPGVAGIVLNSDGSRVIQSVLGSAQEELLFSKYLSKSVQIKGQAEAWLTQLADAIDESLKKAISKGCGEDHLNRRALLQKCVPQVVFTILLVIWTAEIEISLDQIQTNPNGLFRLLQEANRQIELLCIAVRETGSHKDAVLLGQLVVHQLHKREVLELLDNEGVVSRGDFNWVRQLRYYLSLEESDSSNTHVVTAKMMSCELRYGHQFLGTNSRLPYSPQTDRCWLNLCSNMTLRLGSVLVGPAENGKSQTVKQLSRCLGVLCLPLACSPYHEMPSICMLLAGLVQLGVWACLESVTQLRPQVLSILAQQLINIRMAQLQGQSKCFISGQQYDLSRVFTLFSTASPSTQPHQVSTNLSSYFRSIVLLPPELKFAAECLLVSKGYENAKTLARKTAFLFETINEAGWSICKLGLIRLTNVLQFAGVKEGSEPEEARMLRGIRLSLGQLIPQNNKHFNSLINDIFPRQDYSQQESAATSQKEIPSSFKLKIDQLAQMMATRTGTIIVGKEANGKSSCLSAFISQNEEEATTLVTIAPGSLQGYQLFGRHFQGHWNTGLITKVLTKWNKPDKKLVVCFDGAVHRSWVEPFSDLLLGNVSQLCNPDGERIRVKSNLRLVFETDCLTDSPPSFVSRCGVLNFSHHDSAWREVVAAWHKNLCFKQEELKTRPELLSPQLKGHLLSLLQKNIQAGIKFLEQRQQVLSACPTQLVTSLCSLLQALLNKHETFRQDRQTYRPGQKQDVKKRCLTYTFAYAFIWSFGVVLPDGLQQQVNLFLREQFQYIVFPNNDLVQMFYLDPEFSFKHWNELIPSFTYSSGQTFHQIEVETATTLSYHEALKLHIFSQRSVLLAGPAGSGKTKLLARLAPLSLSLSAGTDSCSLQLAIQSRLQKLKKTLLGSKPGKICVVTVDDVSYADDSSGKASPIQLLRTLLDKKTIWDRKQLYQKKVQKIVLACACTPCGLVGVHALRKRFTRHLGLLCLPEMSITCLFGIFRCVLEEFFLTDGFSEAIRKSLDVLMTATMEVTCRLRKQKMANYGCPFYRFGEREVSRLFEGVMQITPQHLREIEGLSKLWLHETTRQFGDRLRGQDIVWFNDMVFDLIQNVWKMRTLRQQFNRNKIVFGALFRHDVVEYEQITDYKRLTKLLDELLEDYNRQYSRKMHLIFCAQAVESVVRLARLFRMSRRHCLLLGPPSSGRKSLAFLAAFCIGVSLIPELSPQASQLQTKSYLQTQLKCAGLKLKPSFMLLARTQSKFMYGVVNSLLSTGEVPNLFGPEQLEEITRELRSRQPPRKTEEGEQCYQAFVQSVRNNLHIGLLFTAGTRQFADCIRGYPALIKETNVLHFEHWPSESYISIGYSYLQSCETLAGGQSSDSLRVACLAELCKEVHLFANSLSQDYRAASGRKVFHTIKSYLDFLKLFSNKLDNASKKASGHKLQIQSTLAKCDQILRQNQLLLAETQRLQPLVQKKGLELEELHYSMEAEHHKVNELEKKCMNFRDDLSSRAQQVKQLKEEVKSSLKDVLPKINDAVTRLETISKKEIQTVTKVSKPPESVLHVMEAASVLFTGRSGDWGSHRYMLQRLDEFIENMQTFQRDSIPEERVRRLRQVLQKPSLQEGSGDKMLPCFLPILRWARTIEQYAAVSDEVRFKKQKIDNFQAEIDNFSQQLEAEANNFVAAKLKYETLLEETRSARNRLNELDLARELAYQRHQKAQVLIHFLDQEKPEWANRLAEAQAVEADLVGKVFLASAVLAYCGPYPASQRADFKAFANAAVLKSGISMEGKFQLGRVLCRPADMLEWQQQGLHREEFMVENAVMATQNVRYPLLLDPHQEGIRWLRNLLKNTLMAECQLGEDFGQLLQESLKSGMTMLVGQGHLYLTPLLEQVLERQICTVDGAQVLLFGEEIISFDRHFFLFLTTAVAWPSLPSSHFHKLCVIDFALSGACLQARVVELVAGRLSPKGQLLAQQIENLQTIQSSDEFVLQSLTEEDVMGLIDDSYLVQTLVKSSTEKHQARKRVRSCQEAMVACVLAEQQSYSLLAPYAASLFQLSSAVSCLHPIYQFSFQQFSRELVLFITSDKFTFETGPRDVAQHLCRYYKRSLFEQHKLIFTVCYVLKMKMLHEPDLGPLAMMVFQRSSASSEEAKQLSLQQFQKRTGLDGIAAVACKDWFETLAQSDLMQKQLVWGNLNLTALQKLVLAKIVRPDKFSIVCQNYIISEAAPEALEHQNFCLAEIVAGTPPEVPIVLTCESQVFQLRKLAASIPVKLSQMIYEPKKDMLETVNRCTGWVFFDLSLMAQPNLRFQSELLDGLHKRQYDKLFVQLTSGRPVGCTQILQKSLKLAPNQRSSVRDVLRATWHLLKVEECGREAQATKLLWGLSYLHAAMRVRNGFDEQGFSHEYRLDRLDFQVLRANLLNILNQQQSFSWDCIAEFAVRIGHAAKVARDSDLKVYSVFAKHFLSADIFNQKFRPFPHAPEYVFPDSAEPSAVQAFLDKLPQASSRGLVGLHPRTKLPSFGCSLDSGETAWNRDEALLSRLVSQTLSSLPAELDVKAYLQEHARFEDKHNRPFVPFLQGEAARLNSVVAAARLTLLNLRRILEGSARTSDYFEEVADCLLRGQTPREWNLGARQTRLRTWSRALQARTSNLRELLVKGMPFSSDIGLFLNPKFFLTSVLQAHCRNLSKESGLDEYWFNFKFTDFEKEQITSRAVEGTYIHALALKNATLDRRKRCLFDSQAGPLQMLPILQLVPFRLWREEGHAHPEGRGTYACPVQQAGRRGSGSESLQLFSVDLACGEQGSQFFSLRGAKILYGYDTVDEP